MDKNSRVRLVVTKIPNINTLIIKQIGYKKLEGFFTAEKGVLMIDIPTLAYLLKFLIINKLMSRKVLEGILSEIEEL